MCWRPRDVEQQERQCQALVTIFPNLWANLCEDWVRNGYIPPPVAEVADAELVGGEIAVDVPANPVLEQALDDIPRVFPEHDLVDALGGRYVHGGLVAFLRRLLLT